MKQSLGLILGFIDPSETSGVEKGQYKIPRMELVKTQL